jgi:hypothetical protein
MSNCGLTNQSAVEVYRWVDTETASDGGSRVVQTGIVTFYQSNGHPVRVNDPRKLDN